MKSWEEIYDIMMSRRMSDPDLFRMMSAVKDRYNNDVVIPLPDVEGEPDLPAPAPVLVADAIDNLAMRANSSMPIITTPQKENTQASRKRAESRRKAWYGRWHDAALIEMGLGRGFRQWGGYGSTVMMATPRLKKGDKPGARIRVVDPLTAYPEPRDDNTIAKPSNIGFVYGVSREWLMVRFGGNPQVQDVLGKTAQSRVYGTCLWDIVEWWDEDDRVIGLLGPRDYGSPKSAYESTWAGNQWEGIQLLRTPNRAGVAPVVSPRRITLDRIEGQVAKMLPIDDMLGRMYALEYVAAQKNVFPDLVVLGNDAQPPQLVHGRWIDGREGEANLVMNASKVDMLRSDTGVNAFATTDRLERAARITGGSSPLSSGESMGASLRTGRAFDTVAGFSIDPRVQEAHRVFGRMLTELNECVAEVEKGWFGSKKISVYTGWLGDDKVTEYKPSDVFGDTTLNTVEYPFPGSDVNEINVGVIQMNAAGLLSKRTARAKHPHISNPEDEERQDIRERLIEAQLAGLLQRASQGELPEIDLAEIVKQVEDGKPLYEAVIEAQKAAQKRQATPAPEPAGAVPGGPAGLSPGAMPGMANPGAGAEMAPPNAGSRIQETPGDVQRLQQLLYNIKFSGQGG